MPENMVIKNEHSRITALIFIIVKFELYSHYYEINFTITFRILDKIAI
jgi:hypothetical protein